jgi:hypothetical protein
MSSLVHFLINFPDITSHNFRANSPPDHKYNCIAWAANDDKKWWWPDKFGYWPKGVTRQVTTKSFVEAFATLGYEVCGDGELSPGLQKVVLYLKDGRPSHMARQNSDGTWVSKLGNDIDVVHDTPSVLDGPAYGQASIYLSRPAPQ